MAEERFLTTTEKHERRSCIREENKHKPSLKMAQRERLRALLNERLASTGDGIYELFEDKIREYEEEVNFLNEEYNLRQKLLDAAMKQGMPVVLCEEEPGPSENAQSPSSPQIKKETDEDKQQQQPKGNS